MKMLNTITVIRTVISYILCVLVALLFFLPCLILLIVLPERHRVRNKYIYALLDLCYKGVLKAFFIPIDLRGQIQMSPAIIIANHQSALDIPLVGTLFNGRPHLWYVLAYYKDTPLFGFIIRRLGVMVDPHNQRQAAGGLVHGIKLIEQRQWDCIVFPEGGRYNDGMIHKFYRGFALIAKKTGRPIIPVFLHNAGKVYPPYSFWIYWYPITIIVGEPLWYSQNETEESFVEKVRDWFISKHNLKL
ncbi:MAG TPA: 1-acyl-sn-glycerol-3-phosphate acyltransferase [Candidatus Babeliaceae bacterium]|nr:1-acyl-sn-glycerol-3-phosphate acyltransferase [Candidatus Babeliaceae bacterium]